jgi:hypothetical protein
VQPRETPLHDPAVGTQSRAVQGAAAGDGRHDAAGADLVAVDVMVVAPVGEEESGLRRGRPIRPRTGGTRRAAAGAG